MKKFGAYSILLIFFIISCDIEKPKYSLNVEKKNSQEASSVKNIILMIADGCGFNHIDAANYYQYNNLKSQSYENFPVYFPVNTSPALSGKFKSDNGLSWHNGYNSGKIYSEKDFRMLGYTGSGAAATAMATGRKTYNASIGMDVNFKPLKSILHRAKTLDKSTGVVTSVQFAHATPASFVVNNVHRNNYEEISLEMINSDIDLIFGCGNPEYDSEGNKIEPKEFKYVGGKKVWTDLKNKIHKRKLITEKSEFLDLIKKPKEALLLGVPKVHSTLQEDRGGDKYAETYTVPGIDGIPNLAEMSLAALQTLNLNNNGFFVMIEGGAVDWASHSNYSGRMIEELIDFNIAVDSVVNWVESNSNWEETLVIITADHETGYLTGNDSYNSRIKSNGLNNMPDMKWNSTGHTNVLIPLFAKGNGLNLFDDYADEVDSLRGYFIQNSEIGQVMFRVLK
jgi:alkaline phosphatase